MFWTNGHSNTMTFGPPTTGIVVDDTRTATRLLTKTDAVVGTLWVGMHQFRRACACAERHNSCPGRGGMPSGSTEVAAVTPRIVQPCW